jgi:hypothetical protein
VPAGQVGRQHVGVAVVDLDRQDLGERGIELAVLVLIVVSLLFWAGATWARSRVQTSRRMPRVLL